MSNKKKNKYLSGNNPRAILVVNTVNGIFYDCIRDAAKAHQIDSRKLSAWVKGDYKNKSNIVYA